MAQTNKKTLKIRVRVDLEYTVNRKRFMNFIKQLLSYTLQLMWINQCKMTPLHHSKKSPLAKSV